MFLNLIYLVTVIYINKVFILPYLPVKYFESIRHNYHSKRDPQHSKVCLTYKKKQHLDIKPSKFNISTSLIIYKQTT